MIKQKNNKKENSHRINDDLRFEREIRLIGDNIEKPGSLYSYYEAINMAKNMELDLVEVSKQNNQISICKIIDYGKFLYQLKKRDKENKQKNKQMVVKELRFSPQTDEHDFNFKLNHAKEFLQDGNKVKACVIFKGRSIIYKEQGEILLLRFANELEEFGKVEFMPKLEGKQMMIVISPKTKH